ncbi:aspartate--tRNA ligase [Salinispira pacifica]|uniref:Aspartate--tRNA(Asp/Asn) ligase n=1 Tax=Salinispira pacifica TaxID=1307761 RepID=V5WDE9_9SPIO|nr:aspartate--tRNA ligase [Salinispira pacifica]AHC13574.1 Aspartyl-tRNA synthetase [Salinispira pacifica]
MEQYKRSHTCGELTAAQAGERVTLNGWVHRNRNHGGVHFINLRDRYGITQVVIDEDASADLRDTAESLKYEYCIAVEGTVRRRPDSMVNTDMTTGEVEIQADTIVVLTTCETLPFMIDERSETNEDLRLKYRYLDLRSFSMQRKIKLRADVSYRVREYLGTEGFLEIETPTMIRSTPEGARDFLIPSRLNPGSFYAMPQSPQLFKQILMVSGFDKYFQLAHCFRDEDLRGDRQPEHTQVDIEMSFVDQDDIFRLIEGLMEHVFKHTLNIDLKTPFPRISYDDAMNLYGSDKPDLRFDMEMQDFNAHVPGSGFGVFESVVENGGAVKVLVAPGAAGYSRKQITDLEETAKTYGAKGLAWTKVSEEGTLEGGIGKFFTDSSEKILSELSASPGDLLLFVADSWKVSCTALGAVRKRLGSELELVEKGGATPSHFAFAWIVDFPLFEYDEEGEKWEAAHHMFTMPQAKYLDSMENDPGAVKGALYDLVCNGIELASGSIRIHDPRLQQRIFDIVGFNKEEAERRFGFLMNAFRYGAPPHGGIAPGLDRLVMLMSGESTIREVMAFPKNTQGINPMDDSPSPVDPAQLKELGLELKLPDRE